MSGICGICAPGTSIDSTMFTRMAQTLALSDDNDVQIMAGDSAALGVSPRWPGQELADAAGIRIAIDADLYNVGELKSLLAQRGNDSKDWSTALCLAHLYLADGPAFLNRLHGAFCLALWDGRARRLLLAVDRLGIKGLYWGRDANRVVFASRLGAIRTVLPNPSVVEPKAITQYLLFSVIPHPLTIIRGVEKLAPGTRLLFERGEARLERYWDLSYEESPGVSESQWAQQVREAMSGAVRLHLAGSIPQQTGAYLSGGTDSSSVVAFASECQSPVKTFSIFFDEAAYSEASFARTTSRHFRTSHHEKSLGAQEAFEAIPKIARYFEEPFANSSAFGAYYCAALARENGVDTLLAGDGGDELFAGNSRYADDKHFAYYQNIPSWLRHRIIEPAVLFLPSDDGILSLPRKYVRRASIPNPRRIFSYGFFLSTEPSEIFTADFLAQSPVEGWMDIANGHYHEAKAKSDVNRLLYLDTKMILADNDIRKVSGTAELAGVRVRYPLLDYRLAELAARIPSSLKLKGYNKRYIFKRAMSEILPREVLYKKKHGFGVPLGLWLLRHRGLNELMCDLFADSRTRQRGYFRPEFYDQLLRLHRENHQGFYGEVAWYLLALELWHREHFDRAPGLGHA
jgi:asparagine synthase (glutamine-hydrolysing)